MFIYKIIVTQEEEGLFVASCPDLEGAWAEANTSEDAIEYCKDAIKGVLKYHQEKGIRLENKIKSSKSKKLRSNSSILPTPNSQLPTSAERIFYPLES